jgi:exopolysaccharide production repressor protein
MGGLPSFNRPGVRLGRWTFRDSLWGMAVTLLAILGWIYAATGSLWQSLGWTFVAALLLQAGYFIVVLFLIYGRASREAESPNPAKVPRPLERDGIIYTLLSRLL